jgi:hypothetical protein
MPTTIDVELARVELASPDLVVAHLKPGVKITVPRVIEVRQARRAMTAGVPSAMYVIAPGDLDWQSDTLGTDFFGPELERIKALAVMVDDPVFTAVVNLYFGLFPERCPVKVVGDLEEGYDWLAKQGFGSGRVK